MNEDEVYPSKMFPMIYSDLLTATAEISMRIWKTRREGNDSTKL